MANRKVQQSAREEFVVSIGKANGSEREGEGDITRAGLRFSYFRHLRFDVARFNIVVLCMRLGHHTIHIGWDLQTDLRVQQEQVRTGKSLVVEWRETGVHTQGSKVHTPQFVFALAMKRKWRRVQKELQPPLLAQSQTPSLVPRRTCNSVESNGLFSPFFWVRRMRR